jgi:uncharacterized membrane protein
MIQDMLVALFGPVLAGAILLLTVAALLVVSIGAALGYVERHNKHREELAERARYQRERSEREQYERERKR